MHTSIHTCMQQRRLLWEAVRSRAWVSILRSFCSQVHVCICVHMFMNICIYRWLCLYICIHIDTCMFICSCACTLHRQTRPYRWLTHFPGGVQSQDALSCRSLFVKQPQTGECIEIGGELPYLSTLPCFDSPHYSGPIQWARGHWRAPSPRAPGSFVENDPKTRHPITLRHTVHVLRIRLIRIFLSLPLCLYLHLPYHSAFYGDDARGDCQWRYPPHFALQVRLSLCMCLSRRWRGQDLCCCVCACVPRPLSGNWHKRTHAPTLHTHAHIHTHTQWGKGLVCGHAFWGTWPLVAQCVASWWLQNHRSSHGVFGVCV